LFFKRGSRVLDFEWVLLLLLLTICLLITLGLCKETGQEAVIAVVDKTVLYLDQLVEVLRLIGVDLLCGLDFRDVDDDSIRLFV